MAHSYNIFSSTVPTNWSRMQHIYYLEAQSIFTKTEQFFSSWREGNKWPVEAGASRVEFPRSHAIIREAKEK